MIGLVAMLMLSSTAAANPITLPDFLTDAQKIRLVQLRRTRMLFRGEHRRYFVDELHTQHHFKPELVGARVVQRYVTVNLTRNVCTKIADLICLKPPLIEAPGDYAGQDDAIARIDRDSGFSTVLYEAAMTSAFQGEAWWQVFIRNDLGTPTGGAIIGNVPAEQCFPDADTLRPNGTYGKVVKQWIVPAPKSTKINLLVRETHEPGLVRNELFQLDDAGRILNPVSLDLLPATAGKPPEQKTGVNTPLLQQVPNFMVDGKCVSDLDAMDELIDQINAAATQIARVIAKHADPKMGLPEDLFDEQGNIKATDEAFAFKNKDETPFYIVWNAQLDFAFRLLDWAQRTYLMLNEVAPSLIGMKEGAAAEAWKRLRLEAAPTLAKVARRLLYLDRAVKDIWLAAHGAENALIPGLAYDYAEPDITWRDGLPIDEDTQATTIATLAGAGRQSIEAAVHQLIGDPEQADAEIERIKTERDEAMPPLFQQGGLAAAGNG